MRLDRSIGAGLVAAILAASPLALPTTVMAEDRADPFKARYHTVDRMSAKRAFTAAEKGEVLLVDIRPSEAWAAFGVPEHAETADFYGGGFYDLIDVMTEGDKDMPIALICFTGGRSEHAARELMKRGYSTVYDVPEGIDGSSAGIGWRAAGLPMVDGY